MRIEAISDTGLVRKTNEDCYLINNDLGLYIVADGMGGHNAGEIASFIAVKTIEQVVVEMGSLREAIETANMAIYAEAGNKPEYSGMGTTVTALLYRDGEYSLGHVGDSRCYLITEQEIRLLTKDHSLVYELFLSGQITEEEVATHPHRHMVTRALGTDSRVEVDILFPTLTKGDKLLLCTDGLSNHVKQEEFAEVVNGHDSIEALEILKKLAFDRGGLDNLTALLIEL